MLDQDKADRVQVSIRDYALPGALHKPKWKINALAGAVFGVLIGGLIVFILEWLEADILRTTEDVEARTGVAVLGVIPNTTSRSARRASHQAGSLVSARAVRRSAEMTDTLGLVTLSEPLSPASEAYRTLRMNLQFAALDKPLRSLLITSPGPGEGKSTTLANLAVTMAQVEQRVIIVDCDLRRPSLHRLLGLQNEAGLTTMMVDDQALENPPLQQTAVNNLRFLASGPPPPRPSDLMGSQRMVKIIERLLAEADILLFDAPQSWL